VRARLGMTKPPVARPANRLLAGLASLALLAGGAGCGGPGAPAAVTVRDSLGVTIVENGEAQLEQTATLGVSQGPVLSIETTEAGTFVLHEVRAVVPLPGGGWAVGNEGTGQVLLFDAEGGLVRTVGRPGEGPGELRSIASVAPLPGDSLAVWDPTLRRLTIFDAEGRAAREVSLGRLMEGEPWSELLPLAGGHFALAPVHSMPEGREPGVSRRASEFHRVSSTGDVVASYGSVPGHEVMVAEPAPGRVLYGPVFFGARTAAAVVGETLVVGTGESPEVRFYSPALTRVLRWPHTPLPVTEGLLEEVLEIVLAGVPEAARGPQRELFRGLPHGDTVPPYEDLLVSDRGELWVGEYMGAQAAADAGRVPSLRWLVFDGGGALSATARTPEGFRLHAVSGGSLAGVHRDEQGLESIRVYRLEDGRPRAAPRPRPPA